MITVKFTNTTYGGVFGSHEKGEEVVCSPEIADKLLACGLAQIIGTSVPVYTKAINPVVENKAIESAPENKAELPVSVELDDMTKAELVTYAKENGIDIDARKGKEKLIAEIKGE